MSNLKPCPHCGSEADYSNGQGAVQVWCKNEDCGNMGFVVTEFGDKDAIELWNNRSFEKLHKIDLEFIAEALTKINNQTMDSRFRWKMVLALKTDVENLLKKLNSIGGTGES